MRTLLAAALTAAFCASCAHEISSEERLERETSHIKPEEALSRAELLKLKCDDTADGLAKARADNRPETDRVQAYMELFSSLTSRTQKIESAMSRNPDLAFKEGSQDLVSLKENCVAQSSDVRLEFDRYVRDLVEVPTVQEIKGGSTVTVARLDLSVLKQAVELLNADDRDSLLSRLALAEKRIDVPGAAKGAKKK